MVKQSYGTSTGGVNRSEKGDLPSDKKFTGYNSRGPLTDLSTKGSLPDKKFSGYNSPAPKAAPGKGNPSVRNTKESPRTYVPSRIKQIFDPTPFATPVAKKPPAKKPTVSAKPTTRGATAPTKNSTLSNKPPATRFGTVTGKTTGTTVSGGGGYGGGGTRGGGSLSGQGSGSRTAGTSRTGGTKQNNPVRG